MGEKIVGSKLSQHFHMQLVNQIAKEKGLIPGQHTHTPTNKIVILTLMGPALSKHP